MRRVRRVGTHPHIRTFLDNLAEVRRLTEIHAVVAGGGPGHKHRVEVLNKSAVVLLVACWEAFIEDMASAAFRILVHAAPTPAVIPTRVLMLVSKALKQNPDDRRLWDLAGEGWKSVLRRHADAAVSKFVSPLNTPRAAQCDELCQALMGIEVSPHWHWHGMSASQAARTLDSLITLRGEIAHRVAATKSVRKKYVTSMRDFVARLAQASHNAVWHELRRRVTPPRG